MRSEPSSPDRQIPNPLVQKLREIPSVAACYKIRNTQQQMFPGMQLSAKVYRATVKPKVEAVIDKIVREFF
jgi:uncharacterized protein YdeI (YjbR/CyaY-like superfamily)